MRLLSRGITYRQFYIYKSFFIEMKFHRFIEKLSATFFQQTVYKRAFFLNSNSIRELCLIKSNNINVSKGLRALDG